MLINFAFILYLIHSCKVLKCNIVIQGHTVDLTES